MKSLASIFFALVAISVGGSWLIGSYLIQPATASVGKAPADLNAESVEFNDVHGWFIRNGSSHDCILLMHGIRSNRLSMISRAKFLIKGGYSVFLIDLQAHGESPGQAISFGLRESKSAHNALSYLKSNMGCHKVASIGVSLGGAASLLGDTPLAVDAYILEAVYPSIEQAIYNRIEMRLGVLARALAPILYSQIPLRLNIPLGSLQPKESILKIKAPVLIIAGTKDQHTTLDESKDLYKSAPSPKQLWLVEGAAHTDFYKYSPQKYESIVLSFLQKHFRGEA